MKNLSELVRPNILTLEPYSCARNEFSGRNAKVFIDANENPYNEHLNRYPDPLQRDLKQQLSALKHVPADQIFLGNGSDEAIDLVYRVFCEPGVDNVVAMAPTYGMYKVCADINAVEYRAVALKDDFQLDVEAMLAAADEHTKVMWLCSPNNPTANDLSREAIAELLERFQGIVVIDEAYADFSQMAPFRLYLDHWPNMIVLNTFSKLWAHAAIRLGMAFASKEIIALFNKVKYPYNINLLAQQQALNFMSQVTLKSQLWRNAILREREMLLPCLAELRCCLKVYPTSANFVLIKVTDADRIYQYLIDKGVVVRNRNRVQLCENCLRITIGTPEENNQLLGALRQYRP